MVPGREEKQSALNAVLASDTFSRSEQLRAFLRFVCEREMADQTGEITEYLIGTKALGRPENFSPIEDSSVRTRAYELRQRLKKYYEQEDPSASLRIELPRGSYTPKFLLVEPEPSLAVEAERPLPPLPPAPRARAPWLSGFAAGLFLAAIVAAAAMWAVRTPGPDPDLKRAWEPLTDKDSEILICIGTPLHLLVTPYLGAVPENSPRYPAPAELYPLFSRYRDLPKDAHLEMQPVQKSVPLGNLESVAKVLATLQTLHAQTRLLPETNSPLTALRKRSAVLFGSPWYSRSAAVLLENTPWGMRWDEASQQVGIWGQGPQSGKNYLPQRGPRGEYQEVFGLITVLPNDTSTDGERSIVVFSGLTSAGTHGAASFFTSGAELKKLGEKFRAQGLTQWPRSYQVLVRCRASGDAQLLSYSYEAHDVMIR